MGTFSQQASGIQNELFTQSAIDTQSGSCAQDVSVVQIGTFLRHDSATQSETLTHSAIDTQSDTYTQDVSNTLSGSCIQGVTATHSASGIRDVTDIYESDISTLGDTATQHDTSVQSDIFTQKDIDAYSQSGRKMLTINVLSLNVCGLKSKLLLVDFIELITRYDVITMCETRCDDVDMEKVKETFKGIGFDVVYKNRFVLSRYKSGGLAIAVKDNVNFTWKLIRNLHEALLSIRIEGNSLGIQKDLVISSVYIPPSHSRYAKVLHFEELDNFLLSYAFVGHYHLLCGDFNAHTGVMDDVQWMSDDCDRYLTIETDFDTDFHTLGLPKRRNNEDVTHDRSTYGKKLVDVCKNNYVLIFNGRLGEDREVGKATTTYKTTVDYMIGSWDLTRYVTKFNVLSFDPVFSDVHCCLHAELHFQKEIEESDVIASDQIDNYSRLNERPGKWDVEKRNDYLTQFDDDVIHGLLLRMDELSVEETSKILKQLVLDPAVKVFPPSVKIKYKKKSNNASMDGYDFRCLRSRKEYHKAKHNYNVRKTNANFNIMITKSKNYRREIKRVQNKQRTRVIKQLKENKSKDPSLYWKIIKGYKKGKDISITLNTFYEHFKQLSEEAYVEERLDCTYDDDVMASPILNGTITTQEIMKCINKLKNNKSPGSDMIINEYIKCTKELMCPVYVKLFNKILDTGDFPSEWMVGVVVPLYKNKGDINDCNNYRGITLLSCVGKLFTSVLNERLKEFSDFHNIIGESQAGFRHEYSTLDHIFVLKNVIDLFKWKNKKLFCLFVDYAKAFDSVWREGLWYKLVKSNVKGKILNVIQSMYANIKSCVLLNDELSETFVCSTGVRQGENLSPLLFAYYVNDIEEELINKRCKFLDFSDDFVNRLLKILVLMYADDTVVLCDSEEEMRRVLTALHSYTNKWKLSINCSKTKIVVFNRGRRQINYNFQFNSNNIETVDEYKYLGITFNCNGKLRSGQKQLVEQAKKAMYSVIGTSRNLDLPIDIQLEMYSSMVLSVQMYAAEIWGYNVIRDMELLHTKFLKHVLFVHGKTSNDIVYGELGVYPLEVDIKCRMINFWVRLITGRNSKLSFLMYRCLLRLYQEGLYSSPWLIYIRNICNNCGMSFVWDSQSVINPTWFKKVIERRLRDQWITVWNANLGLKSICSSYKMYKDIYCLEDYLVKLSKVSRIWITKFRASNNKLPITVGRYNNISREERVCVKCNENVIGDEYHVMLMCENEDIVRLRNQYIPRYYTERPNQHKYVLLMQTSNMTILNKLSLFIRKVLMLFR